MTTILGIKVSNRLGTATEVQEVLTKYGCEIKTRLGLHEMSEIECTNRGLILLEIPKEDKALELKNELEKISGIEIKEMKF